MFLKHGSSKFRAGDLVLFLGYKAVVTTVYSISTNFSIDYVYRIFCFATQDYVDMIFESSLERATS